jgi:hypothetical protein
MFGTILTLALLQQQPPVVLERKKTTVITNVPAKLSEQSVQRGKPTELRGLRHILITNDGEVRPGGAQRKVIVDIFARELPSLIVAEKKEQADFILDYSLGIRCGTSAGRDYEQTYLGTIRVYRIVKGQTRLLFETSPGESNAVYSIPEHCLSQKTHSSGCEAAFRRRDAGPAHLFVEAFRKANAAARN